MTRTGFGPGVGKRLRDNRGKLRSIIQDGLTSAEYDHHDRESHVSVGWKRGYAQPNTPTMRFELEGEPPYQMAFPFEAGREMVYFIHAPEVHRVKIGTTTDIDKRLSQMQTGSPTQLRVIKLLPGGRDEERRWHHRFAEKRIEGEWFDDSVLDDYLRA